MDFLGADRLAEAGSVAAAAHAQREASDPAALRFDALYATYRPLLRKIAIRKFGVAVSDADDLVQDVFATYLANPSNVRELHPYLIGAICNASRQHRQRDSASPVCAGTPCAATPDDELIDGVVRNVIIAATLSRLGARCHETLQRFYLNGETAVSIAETRDTSPGYIWRPPQLLPKSRASDLPANQRGVMTMRHMSEAVLGLYALEPSLVPNRAEVEGHLAVCQDCRSAMVAIKAFDAALADRDAWRTDSAGGSSSAAVEKLRAFAGRSAEEDRDALRLLAEYEQPDAAPRFVWADIPDKPEYQTGGIARLLCKRANGMCTRKPLHALALAEATVRISVDLPDATYPRATIHELRGEAWKEQANALCSLGRFDEALEALVRAEAEYRQLPHAGLGLVAVTYIRAGALYEQEQLDTADELARESAEGALHLGATDRCMRALHLQGEIRLRRGDLPGAIELFTSVLRYGEETNDRGWIGREARALGVCHIELMNPAEASRHLYASLQMCIGMDSAIEVTRTQWAIARLTFLQGNPDEAVHRLRGVVGELTSEGMLTDAALAAVHLAEMLHATNRMREIPKLLAGVVQTFIAGGKLSGALAALAYLKEASMAGTVTPAMFSYVRHFIARAERQPALLFAPPPESPV